MIVLKIVYLIAFLSIPYDGFSETTNFNLISSNNINTINYGITFGLVFILVGLAFKISAVPFHMWAPDVYHGSPTSVTLFFRLSLARL